jgi:hypothetical protein
MDGGPTFQYGDMFQAGWNQPGTTFVITGNSYINARGKLVMGRGAAKALAMRLPGIAEAFAAVIRHRGSRYGFFAMTPEILKEYIGVGKILMCRVGVFQVKAFYKDPADPKLIENAVAILNQYARGEPQHVINMNMPGTGWGRLSEAHVLPLLKPLPKSVNIWRFAHEAPRVPVIVKDEDEDDEDSDED